MYARNWRQAWTPAMAYHFPGTAGCPADLGRLTPAELLSLEAQLEQLVKAGA